MGAGIGLDLRRKDSRSVEGVPLRELSHCASVSCGVSGRSPQFSSIAYAKVHDEVLLWHLGATDAENGCSKFLALCTQRPYGHSFPQSGNRDGSARSCDGDFGRETPVLTLAAHTLLPYSAVSINFALFRWSNNLIAAHVSCALITILCIRTLQVPSHFHHLPGSVVRPEVGKVVLRINDSRCRKSFPHIEGEPSCFLEIGQTHCNDLP